MANSTKTKTLRRNKLSQPDLGQVKQVPLDLLKPYPTDARTHDDKQIALSPSLWKASGG